MNYNDIFPFVKPNYYKGKQLTVRDFREEQNYIGGKFRAVRGSVCGCGVISGLDIVAVDDVNYSVEAGCAIDGYGRDIAVGTPLLKNLTATDGWEELDLSANTYLCIEYAEFPIDRAAPVSDSGRTEYDRVKESCRVYLTNERPAELSCGLCRLSETVVEIFRTENVSVTMSVPKYVNVRESLVITLTVEKRGLDKSLSVGLSFHSDDLCDAESSYYNATDTCDIRQERVILRPKHRSAGMGLVSVPAEAIRITIGDEEVSGCPGAAATFELIDEPVSDRLRREYFHADMSGVYESTPLYLAEFFLTGGRDAPRIEMVRALPFDQYIISAPLEYLYSRIPAQPDEERVISSAETGRQEKTAPEKSNVSSGVESIDITNDLRGKVYYSQEIVHGLGEGNISYSVGFECADSFNGNNDDIVIFGDPGLFEGSPYGMDFPNLSWSIISYSKKGTFRIAVKLLDRVNAGSIRLHWQAVRAEEKTAADMMEVENVSISIKPNLVNIEPRGTISLECLIEGSDDHNCIWNVEDKNGGTISRNGIYKAPSSEGVYTVTATSVKYPTKKAVNYIIVSKHKEL